MPEGGEQHQPQPEEQQPEPAQRLPIESVQTRELADQNLVAYVTGELAHIAQEQGTPEERATREHHRSAAGILEDYLSDIQVNLARGLGNSLDFDRSSALRDVSRVHAAYGLLAWPSFTPEREQQEKLAEAWIGLRQEGVAQRQRVRDLGIGVEITERQAELLSTLTETVHLPYAKSQRFVTAAPLFEGLARQGIPRAQER